MAEKRYMALTTGTNGTLTLNIALQDGRSTSNTQEFAIACTQCPSADPEEGTTDAQGCIISHPTSGKCVVGKEDGDELRLGGCAPGEAGTYALWGGL
ncbi:hypothetical protein H0H81_009889 [Sphagnurus paluster]|uniref:Uncharacterized protein n=1 Tax=Sphagnurus paluster TaxID=117069 RepID=A0A9P7KJ51_9AGAR|nr:hypothetical protein H0H81_009889 [Sphagnurus paluster]